jgi:O-antigen/teichoic acid export membrane protein
VLRHHYACAKWHSSGSVIEDFLPLVTQVPFYFQKRSELRRYKVAFIAGAVTATCAAVYTGVGRSLNGAEYVAVAIGSLLLYLLAFSLIMIPANKILIRILGSKQLREEQRNIARVIINDFFDGKSEIVLPNVDDNLVKAEAVVTFEEYFEEQ